MQQITVPQLIRFKTRSGSINVLKQIGTHYRELGILLLNDTTGEVTQAFVKHHHHAIDINHAIFQRWIQGKGKLPVEWSTLVEVLKDIGLSELASEIEQTLEQPSWLHDRKKGETISCYLHGLKGPDMHSNIYIPMCSVFLAVRMLYNGKI